MSRLRAQEGFTLVELLVGMQLMLIVMFAALMTLEQFTHMGKRGERRVELQEEARQAAREMARSLRNVAAAVDGAEVIVRAEPYDLVFKAVDDSGSTVGVDDRRLQWVRYCVDSADSSRARIVEQRTAAAVTAMPTGTACPASGWDTERVVADRVTNRANGDDRPAWTYRSSGGRIRSVSLSLWLDDDLKTDPRETSLTTGVFLRNQNRPPVAAFTATPAGVRHLLLNGSESHDPEGHPLELEWRDGSRVIGEGLVFDYAAETSGPHTITLEVNDPSGVAASTEQTVVVP